MITKSIPFAGRYRSATFNAGPQRLFAGRNGVVAGGTVTTAGGIATIQPLTWVQEGLFVSSDSALSAPVPSGLVAPYFIAVTSSSSVQSPTEVITPTFVQRPQDAASPTALVASWDGSEWHALPKVSFDEIIKLVQTQNIETNNSRKPLDP